MSNTGAYKELSRAYNEAVSTYESRQRTITSLESQRPQNAERLSEARENLKRALARINVVEPPLRKYEAANYIPSYFFDGRWASNSAPQSDTEPQGPSRFVRNLMRR